MTKTSKSTFAGILPLLCCAGYANASLTKPQPVTIPLVNAGFEKGMAGWSVGKRFARQVTINTIEKRSGNNALKISSSSKGSYPLATQQVNGIQSDITYRFSAWARVAPGSPAVNAAVKIETYNAAAKNTKGHYGYIHLKNDGQWHEFGLTMRTDSDTTHCKLILRVFSQSTVLFDDVKFETSEISVISPVRSAVPVGKKLHLNYQLKLYHPWLNKSLPPIKANLTSSGLTQSIPIVIERGSDNQHFSATAPIDLSSVGDYQLHFSLMRDGRKYGTQYPPMIFATAPQNKPDYLSGTGTFFHQGKPFFPIGMYHVPHTDAGYALLAENGFNAIQGPTVGSAGGLKVALERAKKHGLLVDVPLYAGTQVRKNLSLSLEVAKAFSDDPTVLCWKILDEPDYNMAVADEIPEAFRALKTVDTNHPIELTLNKVETQKFWSHFCDILQVDGYPLPRFPLTRVSDFAHSAKEIMQPWQNLSFVLQSGWTADLSTQPSVAQARSMVYMALIGGAKGIWWYSMHESNGWDLTKTPLWPHMKDINAEIKVLSEPVMTGHEVDGIIGDQTKVLFRAFEYHNKIYLLVTNPTDTPAQTTFTLPGNWQFYYPLNGTVKKQVSNHRITLSLQGVDSRTYILEK